MQNERKKNLIETMKKLNKTMGEEYLTFAEEMAKPEVLQTGIVEFDKLIGGLRCGHTTVIYGANSSGKSTIVYQTIANIQKQDKICALIDMEHSLEPDRAKKLGVNLEELVLIQNCTCAEQAMDIIITLCKDKAVDFIALDSIHALSPKGEQENKKGVEKSMSDESMALLARKLSEFFRKVGGHLFNAKIPLLLIGQCRISGIGTFIVRAGLGAGEAIKFYMYTCVFMRRGQGADSPCEKIKREVITPDGETHMKTFNEPIGFDAVLKLEKSKSSLSAKEHTEIHLPFLYKSGFPSNVKVVDPSFNKPLTEEEVLNHPNAVVVPVKMTEEQSQALDAGGLSQNEWDKQLDKPLTTPYPSEKIKKKLKKSLAETNPHCVDQEALNQSVISSSAIEGIKVTPEDLEAKKDSTPKKRGRPKKLDN